MDKRFKEVLDGIDELKRRNGELLQEVEELKNNKGYEVKEYRLSDKYGEIIYKTGTRYEVASYALENQLMFMEEDGDE